jgi:hypothetical protein
VVPINAAQCNAIDAGSDASSDAGSDASPNDSGGNDGGGSGGTGGGGGGGTGGGTGDAAVIGESCGNPVVISALPFSDSAGLANFANDYGLDFVSGPACDLVVPGGGWMGNATGDKVYSYTPAASGTMTVKLSNPHGVGYETPGFYVTTSCADFATYCIASVKGTGLNGSLTQAITVTGGTTYFIVVDGADYQVSGTGSELPPSYSIDIN